MCERVRSKYLTIFMVNWTKTCHRVLIMSQVRLEAAAGSVLSPEMVNVHSNQIAKHSKSKDRVKNLYTCTNMSQLPSTQNFTSHMSYAHPPTFWRIRPFSRFRFSFAPHPYFQTLSHVSKGTSFGQTARFPCSQAGDLAGLRTPKRLRTWRRDKCNRRDLLICFRTSITKN